MQYEGGYGDAGEKRLRLQVHPCELFDHLRGGAVAEHAARERLGIAATREVLNRLRLAVELPIRLAQRGERRQTVNCIIPKL